MQSDANSRWEQPVPAPLPLPSAGTASAYHPSGCRHRCPYRGNTHKPDSQQFTRRLTLGNRRWLCHMVTHIDDPRTWGIDYDQLYAQLRDELRQGFRYWFDPGEQRIVERHNQAFRIESDEEQLIRSRLRPPHDGEKITLMNAASICQFINGGVVGRGLSSRKVGMVMRRLGFEHTHTRAGEFYKVFQIPVNDIQPTLAMPCEKDTECAANVAVFTERELPF